jgi:hypothetical protein
MPSNFSSFECAIVAENGVRTLVPNSTVKVYDATNEVALPNLASNADGIVPGGVLAVAPGTLVRFRIEHDGHGRCGYAETTTT